MSPEKTKSPFDWMDEEVCQGYVSTREIATDDVHYGWLSPGERALNLLAAIKPRAKVLDIGCGAGENLIALARKGHDCYGLDISPCMIDFAAAKLEASGLPESAFPSLELCDMRHMTAFANIGFDLILSVYSCEFLDSLKEFRDVLAMAFGRLMPGGRFVCCFSHPLQHHAHTQLLNETGRTGLQMGDPLMFSFRDTVSVITDAGFVIDRIVEQETRAPSQISYEDSIQYPYHFARGKNPCDSKFDHISNSAPHTVIYSVSKPITSVDTASDLATNTLQLAFGDIQLWGKRRTVNNRWSSRAGGVDIHVVEVAPYDSLVAVCFVASAVITTEDLAMQNAHKRVQLLLDDGGREYISSYSVLGLLHGKLKALRYSPIYRRQRVQQSEIKYEGEKVYIHRIDPVFGLLSRLYGNRRLGVLILVNNVEPAGGTVAMSDFIPRIGDKIDVLYTVSGWGEDWRPRPSGGKNEQLKLL